MPANLQAGDKVNVTCTDNRPQFATLKVSDIFTK